MTEVWPISRPAQFGEGTVWPQRGWAFPSWRPRCPPRLPQPVYRQCLKSSGHKFITCFPSSAGSLARTDCVANPSPLKSRLSFWRQVCCLLVAYLQLVGETAPICIHLALAWFLEDRLSKYFLNSQSWKAHKRAHICCSEKEPRPCKKKRRGPFYLDSTDQISLRIIHLTRSIQIFQTWQSVLYAPSPRLVWGRKTLSPADRSEGRWAGRPIAELRRCRNSSPQLPRHTASSLCFLKTNTQIQKHSTLNY